MKFRRETWGAIILMPVILIALGTPAGLSYGVLIVVGIALSVYEAFYGDMQ